MTRAEEILLLVEKGNSDFHRPQIQRSKKILINSDNKIKPHKHPHKKGNGI